MNDTTKLTLSVNKRVIQKAKRVAKVRGTSVSAMFTQLVDDLKENTSIRDLPLGPLTRKALSIGRLPKGVSADRVRLEALMEKYGKHFQKS